MTLGYERAPISKVRAKQVKRDFPKLTITEELVDFCAELKYRDLPREVIDKAKYHALDFVGVAAGGSRVDSSGAIYHTVKEFGLQPNGSIVIGTKLRATCQYAALANGTAAHSLELDDLHNRASVHPAVVIFPAAFAVSEFAGCGGQKFIEAVVLGYEVMARLGMAQNPVNPYGRGFYPTGICGVFGAAVSAGKVLNLSKEQMLNAMGIGGSQASGIMEAEGTWTHRLHSGWAAHNGVVAALMAKSGFKGPATVIEGEHGFLHCFSDGSDLNNVLGGLGDSYEITKTSIKSYSCCRYEHSAIDGILRIVREHNVKAEEVERVTCGILKAGWRLIAQPEEVKRQPRTVMEAMASMPFGAAVAILYGNASLDEHTQANVDSAKVKALMARVSCVQDPELDKVFPEQWPATVEIVTRAGKTFSTRINYPKGDYQQPLSWEELTVKYENLSLPVYPRSKRGEILARLKKLEEEEKMADFCALLLGS